MIMILLFYLFLFTLVNLPTWVIWIGFCMKFSFFLSRGWRREIIFVKDRVGGDVKNTKDPRKPFVVLRFIICFDFRCLLFGERGGEEEGRS